mgnify:CR=1 FL=1
MNHTLGLSVQFFISASFDYNFYEAKKYFKRSFNQW